MFTGIVEELGRVRRRSDQGTARLDIEARTVLDDLAIGASVAVNGVCLTVVERSDDGFAADVVAETLARSNLGRLEPGDPVNLERPMRADGRFGGHLVQGHVDATVPVLAVAPDGDGGAALEVGLPDELAPFVVEKGSVALDGVSLTVAGVGGGRIRIALIPHTLAVTTFGSRRVGDLLNLEVDYVAKVIANLAAPALRAGAIEPAAGAR